MLAAKVWWSISSKTMHGTLRGPQIRFVRYMTWHFQGWNLGKKGERIKNGKISLEILRTVLESPVLQN